MSRRAQLASANGRERQDRRADALTPAAAAQPQTDLKRERIAVCRQTNRTDDLLIARHRERDLLKWLAEGSSSAAVIIGEGRASRRRPTRLTSDGRHDLLRGCITYCNREQLTQDRFVDRHQLDLVLMHEATLPGRR